jgi:HEAT repeat protein
MPVAPIGSDLFMSASQRRLDIDRWWLFLAGGGKPNYGSWVPSKIDTIMKRKERQKPNQHEIKNMAKEATNPADLGTNAKASSPEEMAKLQEMKIVEELNQFKASAKKIQVEIQKLDAEVKLLTVPHRTWPGRFTIATTVCSAIAVVIAFFGVAFQAGYHKTEVAIIQAKVEKLQDDEKSLKENRDKLKNEIESQQREISREKEQLKKAKGELADSEFSKRGFDETLKLSAKSTTDLYDYFIKFEEPDSGNGTSTSFFAKEHLTKFLNSLKTGRHDYSIVIKALSHDSVDVRRMAALLLSQIDKGDVAALSIEERTDFANRILTTLLNESDVRIGRLETVAIGRFGGSAAQPLLKKLVSEKGQRRRYIMRALGELRDEASEDVIRALIPFLRRNESAASQTQAIWALGMIGPTAVIAEKEIVKLLPSTLLNAKGVIDPELYALCSEIIASLGRIGARDPDTTIKLSNFFVVQDPKGDLQKIALITWRTVRHNDKVIAEIHKIIRTEPNPAIVEEAAFTLGTIGGKIEIDKLDFIKEPRLALATLISLSALKSADDRKGILKKLLDSRGEAFLTFSMIAALKRKSSDSVPVLCDALAHVLTNPFVRENLVNAIGEVGADSDVAAKTLLSSLQDKNAYVQLAAVRAVGRLGIASKEATGLLADIATDDKVSDIVRLTARRVIFANVSPEKPYIESALKPDSSFDKLLNKHYKSHSYPFENGYVYQLDLKSSDFDAYMYLRKKDGEVLLFDDDGGGYPNARLFYDPTRSEELEIWATTYENESFGRYTLEIRKVGKTKR